MSYHTFNPNEGLCRIQVFELNTKHNCGLGIPEGNPADSFLISTLSGSNQTHVLVDAGKKGHGEKVIIPYLLKHQIETIDRLILSHLHYDHFGGIIDLLRDPRIRIKELLYSPLPDAAMRNNDAGDLNYSLWKELEGLLSESDLILTKVTQQQTGATIQIGGDASLRILSVPDELIVNEDGRTNLNEMNVIVKLHYRQFSALFPGDCGPRQAGRLLGSELAHQVKDTFLLKAAHHGGDESTSEAFIRLCNAQLVVIPCNEVVTRHRPSFIGNTHVFADNGAKLFRCDYYKHIEIVTNGSEVQCIGNTDQYSEQVVFHIAGQ